MPILPQGYFIQQKIGKLKNQQRRTSTNELLGRIKINAKFVLVHWFLLQVSKGMWLNNILSRCIMWLKVRKRPYGIWQYAVCENMHFCLALKLCTELTRIHTWEEIWDLGIWIPGKYALGGTFFGILRGILIFFSYKNVHKFVKISYFWKEMLTKFLGNCAFLPALLKGSIHSLLNA